MSTVETQPIFGEEALDTATGKSVWWDGVGWSYTKPVAGPHPNGLPEANSQPSLPPLVPQDRPANLPLSFAQSRLWLIDQLEGSNTAYNMPESVSLRGELDLEALQRTIHALVERHESLRTRFAVIDGEPTQVIEPELRIELPIEDLRCLDESSQKEQVAAAQRQEWVRPFDLARGPLMRMKLLKLGDRDHILLRTFHHIIFDGWSLSVFNREFVALYEAFHEGRQNPLRPLPIQYADFSIWQRKWLDEEMQGRLLDYWKKQLSGIPEQLELPHDRPRKPRQTFAAGLYKLSLSDKQLLQVQRTSQANHVTTYMALLSVLAVLLQRHSNQPDIVIGSPIANRQEIQLEQLIGFFVNSLVMRIQVDPEAAFCDLLAEVRRTTLDAYAHQDLPFERLVEELAPQRSVNTTPIFQIIFAVQNAPMGSVQLKDLVVESERIRGEELRTRFDLELHVWERETGMDFLWVYNRDMFDPWRVEQMAHHFERLLDAMVAEPERPIFDLEMLSEAEKRQLLVEWNRTDLTYSPCCVHELFEQHAARTPDKTAIIFGDDSLSYLKLNQRANQLARYLMKVGVRPEMLVGICLERSLEMIVALLGILKAGGVYVPIAADLPPVRRNRMIADDDVRHIVTATAHRALFDGIAEHVLTVDGDAARIAEESLQNPATVQFPESPAYVNYTSGSTGQPKGVLVPHASVMRLVCQPNFMRLDNSTCLLQMAPLSFDAATLEIWGALLNGGSLVIMPAGRASIQEIGSVLSRFQVNTLWLTAGLFHQVVDHALESLGSVQQLLAGGDVLSVDHVNRLRRALPGGQLINGYGPTENTTFTCCYPVPHAADINHGVPIGSPINNTRVYVLDENLNPAPVGVTGELYAAGAGLARGYVNRPDLTAERFVPNPSGIARGERMYRTGDLVRWRRDGIIEFVGRNDHQVKVRGYRIELGEIEAVLRSHDDVQDALVMVREQEDGKQLLGYVVARRDKTEQEEAQGSQITHWRQLYESTYRQGRAVADDFNITGWNSSYTGAAIPAEEMRIWVEETVARIRELRPRRVLEIGCGTGLLLTRLAADCESYLGLDFSAEVLAQLERCLAAREDLRHVVLRQGLAHELSFLADDSVDLVILNSVVQYFPNMDYLLDVLAQAVRVTQREGKIFVGDVRSLPLLEAYHTSVQLHKAALDTLTTELRQRILQSRYSEEELVVDPALFTQLALRWEKVGRADPMLKAGAYDNELSRFRYDVVLRLGEKECKQEPEQWLCWDQSGGWRQELKLVLSQKPDIPVGLRGVCDRRVAKAVAAVRLLQTADAGISNAEQLQAAIEGENGEDVNLVMQVAQGLGVEHSWEGFSAAGIYDVVFRPKWKSAGSAAAISSSHLHEYGNTPARTAGIAKVGRALQDYLRERLPEYMVPSAIMVLPEWPLTGNGKIDRKALPVPGWRQENYRAPRTPQEEILCEIFADVLGLERVGIDDNFFELGGHSLLATRVISRVHATLGSEVALRTLFEFPTVCQLAPHLDQSTQSRPLLGPQSRPPQLALSYPQQRLWFLDKLEGASAEYNVPEALSLRGALDLAALKRTIATMVERHEILRTRFAEIADQPVQIIEPGLEIALPIEDLSHLDEASRRDCVAAAMHQEREQPFDLPHGPLLRMKLLKLDAQEHMLLRTYHHIICDAWSQGIFNREFMTLYEAFHEGRENPLAALSFQYADFAIWQRRWLNEETLADHLGYWKKQLAALPEQLALPLDHPRPPAQTFVGDIYRMHLPADRLLALKRLANAHHATLYMTLLAAFAILLQRYSGQSDIVVGSPIANRRDSQLEQLMGLFVNSLVMRMRIQPAQTFRGFLREVRLSALEAYAHQDVPFERLVEELSPQRSLNMSPIFQVLFALQNAPMVPQRLKDLTIESVGRDTHPVRVDLEVHALERDGQFAFYWLYKRDLFDRWRMEQMARHYVRLLEAVLANPDQALNQFDLLSNEEKRQVLHEWNRTEALSSRQQTIAELFEEQVRRAPAATAVTFKTKPLSYAELDRSANQLARYLRKMGVGPEVRVATCIERGPEVIVGLLGILKAGGTYVPLDPDFPAERLAYMIEDTAPPVVLTQTKLLSSLPKQIAIVDLEAERDKIEAESGEAPQPLTGPQNAAYVIYTSGSTGRPKGVVIEHRNVHNMVMAQRAAFAVHETDCVLQFFSFSFDVSIFATLMALCSGARLVLGTRDELLPGPGLLNLLETEEVTIGVLPPIVLDHLPDARLPKLREVIVGGEPWSEELLKTWGQGRRFFNSYGPTETTVQATVGECRIGDGRPSIGRPIANVRIYLLDEEGMPVPVGVAGELYIGGAGVGRGYLDSALTAGKYLPDPFSAEPGARIYRTGDWARWLPDGRIDLLGRKDEQVKIRGYRVELGEIEAVLAQHPSVLQCAVLARQAERREKRLIAYVVLTGQAAAGELRTYLQDKLPEYMVPAQFVTLEKLPLNSSGKVDRQALPDVEFGTVTAGRSPRTPEEEILCQIFAEVLGLSQVSIDDSFFDLGGHSLMATRLASRVRSVMGVELPLRSIFESPTTAALAPHLRQAERSRTLLLAQQRPQRLPMSYPQQRLWFLDRLEGKSTEYHIPEALRLRGKLDYESLKSAVGAIVQRHEVLRTCFSQADDGEPVQIIKPRVELDLPVEDLTALSEESQQQRIAAAMHDERELPFDLSHGPLFRMKLLKLGEDEYVLLRTFHHIITDGWSQGILNRELAAIYRAFNEGRPDPLEPLPIQYADFALWQRQRMDETLADQLSYWKEQLAGIPEELALPKDRPRSPRQTFAAEVCHHSLATEQAAALKRLCQSSQSTLYMALLSAFTALLQRYSSQDDIVVGSPIANRREEQLEKLIGFFVNSLVLRVRVDATETFGELLSRVRGTALDAYKHQDVPFERLVEELSPQRSLNKMPICQVMFLWQNAPMEKPGFKELDVEYVPGKGLQTHFDLELQAMEHGGTVHFNWIYNCGLFDRWRIEKMARHFARFLDAAVASTQTPLHLFPILDEQERQFLLEWNSTDRPYEAEAMAHELFEQQVARTPQATAVFSDNRWITYGELNERANQLAHYLASLGVGPEVKVGICLERGLQMFVGLLGVLKAGAAYVPLDPKYPAERLSYMLEDSQALLLLAGRSRASELPAFAGAVIHLEEQWKEIAAQSSNNPKPVADPENLAYVIYTSGSTGKPKGVAVEHRQLANQLLWAGEALALTSADRVLQKASFSFDVSILETLLPLACGAGVVIAKPGGEQDLDYLVRLGIDSTVTYVDVVPSLLEGLLIHPLVGKWTSLRVMTCGGEALKPHLVQAFYQSLPAAKLWNAYGPTETTIQSTYTICAKEDTLITIGSPVANTYVYVLDRWLNPLPVGVAGELCIGGAGLARGYLKRPELTAERFSADPFSSQPGSRMYRTGDLVRWTVNGNLEFLGRTDDQVKVRGFRIELGEIESALHQCPEVEQAVVVAREDDSGEKRLAAYIVSRERTLDLDKLRSYLKAGLPDYMMPSYFTFLDRLPLTPVGKVDRLALPKPEVVSRNLFVAPRTDLEQSLARVWQEALAVPRVGLDDNFFDLGGHSLLIARIHFILREKLKREIAIVDFFTYPTVRSLAQRLEETEEKPIDISDSQERAARQRANMRRRRQSSGERKHEKEIVE